MIRVVEVVVYGVVSSVVYVIEAVVVYGEVEVVVYVVGTDVDVVV